VVYCLAMKLEKRVQIAVPVRVSVQGAAKPRIVMACTYDISAKGARLTGVTGVEEGEILVVQRAKDRALFRVMWVGKAGTTFHNQIGVMCIEEKEKGIWDVNLGELEEQYEPIQAALPGRAGAPAEAAVSFPAGAVKAHVFPENASTAVAGELLRLATTSCDVKSDAKLSPQLSTQILLVGDGFDLRLRGFTQKSDLPATLRIGLNEIRRGDRRTLNFLMEQGHK